VSAITSHLLMEAPALFQRARAAGLARDNHARRTVDRTEHIIAPRLPVKLPPRNSLGYQLAMEAASIFQVHISHIFSGQKLDRFCEVRWAIWQILHEQGYSSPQIGRLWSKDHGTVLHGIKQAAVRQKFDPQYRYLVETLRQKFYPEIEWHI
jgi:chromosomal replication initiation ATPase DnaA